MNYWATESDEVFATGHYVEDWELRRLSELAAPVRALLLAEAAGGNKVIEIAQNFVRLRVAPSCGVFGLPQGLSFCTPVKYSGALHWDGEEEGVIYCPQTGDRVLCGQATFEAVQECAT
jgi:hypothetical protein